MRMNRYFKVRQRQPTKKISFPVMTFNKLYFVQRSTKAEMIENFVSTCKIGDWWVRSFKIPFLFLLSGFFIEFCPFGSCPFGIALLDLIHAILNNEVFHFNVEKSVLVSPGIFLMVFQIFCTNHVYLCQNFQVCSVPAKQKPQPSVLYGFPHRSEVNFFSLKN